VVAEAGEHAAPRGTRLALWADPAVRVQASAGLLGIALRNLLDNAIAHGKMHGEVSVAVSRHGDAIELAVEDDGPGISETQAERLGERFRRGVHSSGSGLGLSIVHAIASLHGGSVVVARSAAGGARVVLRLPAVATPSPS
jgi:signal transduction histidine kinase